MKREGKINLRFLFATILFFILMAFLVFPVGIKLGDALPNLTINMTPDRNINFTFTPTWQSDGDVIGNCSLWTNFTGTWESMMEFNGTFEGLYNESSNISNNTASWVNYTFTHDMGLIIWDIGCRNGTGSATVLVFNSSNRTLAIDVDFPKVIPAANFSATFNTSDETPIIRINITDINGTGINLTLNGNNLTLNISLLTVVDGDDTILKIYNLSNSSLYCDVDGVSGHSVQCTLDLSTMPLTNGTKNITIAVSDRANHTNVTSFTLTVDQIAPYYDNLSILNDYGENDEVVINDTSPGTGVQGVVFYVVSNWTDNLTHPFEIRLQIFNSSPLSQKWWTVNYTNITGWLNSGWGNLSYVPPEGHNMFEGKNISIRVNATDVLGNVNISTNLTLLVNDTTKPTISISQINGTNYSSNRDIAINWSILEGNLLVAINWSVDDEKQSESEADCNDFGKYNTQLGAESKRNYNFTLYPSTETCTEIGNGTHYLVINARDTWDNIHKYNYTFSIGTGEAMNLSLGLVEADVSDVNQSNITPYTGLYFNYTGNGGVVELANITWMSSCYDGPNIVNSTLINNTYDNATGIYAFNYSGCKGVEANWTINLTATDKSGNSVSAVYQFAVDDLAPTIAVHSPIDGARFTNFVEVNVSAFDQMSRVDTIGYYLDGGYTILNHTINGTPLTAAQGMNTSIWNATINFTAGTHTIKVTVNDTLGNRRNSSVITFVQIGPIVFSEVNTSIESYIAQVFNTNLTNVSIRIKTGAGIYEDIIVPNNTNNTYQILYQIDGAINVSLTDINGSAANWDKINFTPYINNTPEELHVQNNWTNTVLNSTWFNGSIDEFIGADSYYGVVVLPLNDSNRTPQGPEFWWIENEGTLTTRTNISQCTAVFTRTTPTPCWNYTSGGRTEIYVPHFSIVLAVNDSDAPTINVTIPTANQTVSTFVPNITVSSDAKTCEYHFNSSSPSNVSMTKSGTICLSPRTESFKNLTAAVGYNVTFWVTDNNDNTNQYIWHFNISDTTDPDNGIISSSDHATTPTVTISNVNESVNATVWYSSDSNTSLTSSSTTEGTDFTTTQTVTITLSAVTSAVVYYYNVSVCDYNGNCKENGTFSFTQSATAAAAAAVGDGGASGSGGAVPSTNIQASQARMWSSVSSGSSLALAVDKTNIAVTEVSVSEVANELSNVELKASSLKDNPVSASAAGKVYQYLQITKKNIKDEDAVGIKIKFRVTKTWLSDNGLTENDIALWRYKNNIWTMLDTTVATSDTTYANYEAVTPGFSYFAVGNKVAGTAAFVIIDAIREFYEGTSSLTAFDIIDMIRAFYGG